MPAVQSTQSDQNQIRSEGAEQAAPLQLVCRYTSDILRVSMHPDIPGDTCYLLVLVPNFLQGGDEVHNVILVIVLQQFLGIVSLVVLHIVLEALPGAVHVELRVVRRDLAQRVDAVALFTLNRGLGSSGPLLDETLGLTRTHNVVDEHVVQTLLLHQLLPQGSHSSGVLRIEGGQASSSQCRGRYLADPLAVPAAGTLGGATLAVTLLVLVLGQVLVGDVGLVLVGNVLVPV
mmetsp:Transcript_37666/g.95196  ORF Transcript_37666/g.95196 Transcript_37666/m.95196 type:complete len:232 (-) Transcript_37666:670-1365(-)